MSSYYNYKFHTYRMLKVLKKTGRLCKNPKPKDLWKYSLENHKEAIEILAYSEECAALTEIPNFIFIESLKLAQIIQRSEFKADAIKLEEGIEFLSFPKGFKINGFPAAGIMISCGTFETRIDWLHLLEIKSGSPLSKLIFENDCSGYINFTYKCPFSKERTATLRIPFEKLSNFINSQNKLEMMKSLGGYNHETINDEEAEYKLALIHTALKTLVYKQALPDKLVRGCPDRRANDNKFRLNGSILKAPYDMHHTNSPTVVGFHFRQLKDMKYYKGEHQDKPLGSRWVFVSPHERGMKAKTIKD